MSELMKRATPGLALAGVALATVWMFDPGLHREGENTAADGTVDSGGSADSESSTASEAPPESPADTSDCSDPTAVSGDEAMTPWGPVQVRMEVASDGTVCSVQALTYPVGDRKSQMINAMAIPTLDARAAEQGVEFDGVSGATFTTEAYRESMQSILDQR